MLRQERERKEKREKGNDSFVDLEIQKDTKTYQDKTM